MKKTASALGFVFVLWIVLSLFPTVAQIPQFPQNLPPNSVVGRTGITAGPAQAIPFNVLSQFLLQGLNSSFFSNIFNVLGSFWTDINNADGASNANIYKFRDRVFVDDGALESGAWNGGAGGLANSRSGTPINAATWNWAPREASLLAINSWGELGVVGMSATSQANRSGDPHSPTGSATIGTAGFALNNRTTNPVPAWASYFEAERNVGGVGDAFAIEADTGNVGAVIDYDPFTSDPGGSRGLTVGLWNTCGGSSGTVVTYTPCSAAVTAIANGAKWRKGFVVEAGGIDGTVGTGSGGVAVETQTNAEWRWMSAAATPAFELWGSSQGLVLFNPLPGGSVHVGGAGNAPAVSSCGGSPGAASGMDFAGQVTEGTTAAGCTLTFATTYLATPVCLATLNAAGAAIAVTANATSTTQVTFNHASQSGAVLRWICIGN